MNGLMFWPRLPWIRRNSFILYHILISSTTSLSTLMTFCKVNGTSMSPANCSRYNQSLSDLLHQWNAEEMTLSYAGPELAMLIFTNGYLLRGELRPMCCNTRLTVRHVLLSCAKYAHIRRKYFAFNSLFELFRDTPAGFNIQFLRECNLYSMF